MPASRSRLLARSTWSISASAAPRHERIEFFNTIGREKTFARMQLPYDAGFLAGKAFVTYRRRGGAKTTPLPDFYIGAHAAISGYRLLTRDGVRYRTYFPTLTLITPP